MTWDLNSVSPTADSCRNLSLIFSVFLLMFFPGDSWNLVPNSHVWIYAKNFKGVCRFGVSPSITLLIKHRFYTITQTLFWKFLALGRIYGRPAFPEVEYHCYFSCARGLRFWDGLIILSDNNHLDSVHEGLPPGLDRESEVLYRGSLLFLLPMSIQQPQFHPRKHLKEQNCPGVWDGGKP